LLNARNWKETKRRRRKVEERQEEGTIKEKMYKIFLCKIIKNYFENVKNKHTKRILKTKSNK
jgi:hypothetical protein